MTMIITSECEYCIHSTIIKSEKSKVKVHCGIKDRTYYWGQCIQCENKTLNNQR